MKILVTGGSGGIGSQLVQKLLAAKHTVIAPRSAEVNFLNEKSVLSNLNHEVYDVIIHLAFSKSSCQNTLKMMKNALSLRCKLFIHISSWVVNFQAAIIDSYTKSKKLCEDMLRASQHNYVIIRPSLVIGNDLLIWQKNLSLFANCGVSNIFLVGVDEVCNVILNNLEASGRTNFDVYGTRISAQSACELFQCQKPTFMSVIFGIGKPILKHIALFAFLKTNIENKDEEPLPKDCFTAPGLKILQPRSKQELLHILESRGEKSRLFGRKSTLRPPFRSENETKSETNLKIDTSKCNKFVHYEDGFLTMQTGAVFYELFDELDRFDRTVRCIPEFTDLALGACVTTQIHGSSHEYHSFNDQITHLEVWRQGCVLKIKNSDFQKNDSILEVTIRTIPNTPITRHIDLQSAHLPPSSEKLLEILSTSMAPTVVWFINAKKILIWHHCEEVDGKKHQKGSVIRRNSSFLIHWRHAFLPKKIYNQQGHHLLGSWRKFTAIENFFSTHNLLLPDGDVEICVPFTEMERMLEYIPKHFKVPLIAFRSSPKGVWCEFFISAKQKKILDNLDYEKHLGKYF